MKNLSRTINLWIEYLLFGFGFSMALIVALQVFFRYMLNHSLFWSEELARYILVWLTFMGATTAYYRNLHPGVDILIKKVPMKIRDLLSLLVQIISCGLFGIMIVYGFKFAYFVRLQISPALSLPKWTVYSIIPVCGIILLFHGLGFLINDLRKKNNDS